MPTPTPDHSAQPAGPGWRLYLACLIPVMVLLHLHSFEVPHNEGDEFVYLRLAQKMTWTCGNYTTADDPVISRFPSPIYRASPFMHPPLFLYMLKIAAALGAPVAGGLVWQLLAMVLLLVITWRAGRLLQLSPVAQWILGVLIVLDPMILFSTTRLHIDAMQAIFAFAAVLLTWETLTRPRWACTAAAAAAWVLAFNLKLTGVVAAPGLALVWLCARLPGRPPGTPLWRWLCRGPEFRHMIVITLIAGIIGGLHYYRILLAYSLPELHGILFCKVVDPEHSAAFLVTAMQRTRPQAILYFLALYPGVLLLFRPGWRRLLDPAQPGRLPGLLVSVLGGYFFLAMLVVLHTQMRYFEMCVPFLLAAVVWRLDCEAKRARAWVWWVAGVTVLSMVVTGFAMTIVYPDYVKIVPAVFLYCQSLLRWFA